MSRFAYTAVTDEGRRIRGVLRGRDRLDALTRLRGLGHHALELKPLREGASGLGRASWLRRVRVTDLAVATRQLASLLRAGLPVLQALAALRQQTGSPRLAEVLQDLEEAIRRDAGTLSEAMELRPGVFDPVYRGLVRSGEEAGNLPEVLTDLAAHLSRSAKLRGQIRNASIYPAFLLLLGIGAIFVLMTFVVPKFKDLFESFGQELPAPTVALIAVSEFMARWWLAVALGVLALAAATETSARRPALRKRLDRRALRLPVFGPLVVKIEVTRLARTLAALLAGGVGILDALRVTAQTSRNLTFQAAFAGVIRDVSHGSALAVALERAGVFPPLLLSLTRTGEEAGELPEMLAEVAAIYEEESERAISGAVRLLEPVLIILMGGMVGGIVAAVILPIFQSGAIIK